MTPFQRYISLAVGRLDRATPLAATTGLPRKCLVFSDTGAIQAIDANGILRNITSSGGSLIPTDDNVDDLGTAALRWHDGYFGGTVYSPTFSSGASGDVDMTIDAVGTGTINLTAPSLVTPPVATSGTQTAFKVTGAVNLAQTTTVEVPDVFLNLARTVTWAAGDITAQRAVKVTAPTYSIPAGVGTRTITTASTMSLSGAPALAAGTILARSYALFVESGVTNLAGGVGVSNATNNNAATTISAVRLVDSAASGVAGVGANGIASRITLTAPNNAGTQTFAGFVTGTLTDVTAAAEVSQLSLGGAFANSGCEALRLIGLTGTIVNRLDITPAADSGIVTVAVAGGATAGSIAISANGVTGVTSLRGSVATNIVAVDNGGGASAPRLGFYNAGPVVRATAIAAPTNPGVGYVQAEAQSAVDAINFIRTALTNIGITL